jgi:UPF0716 family protein affecting phage T7 exclusion
MQRRKRRRRRRATPPVVAPAPAVAPAEAAAPRGRFPLWWLWVLLSFAEVGLTIGMTRALGPLPTYALYAVPAAVGLVIQSRRWPSVRDELAAERRNAAGKRAAWRGSPALARYAVFLTTGFLLLVPGVLSHGAALVLLAAPRWAEKKLLRWSEPSDSRPETADANAEPPPPPEHRTPEPPNPRTPEHRTPEHPTPNT